MEDRILKTFYNNADWIKDVKSLVAMKVLFSIFMIFDTETNIVTFVPVTRKMIMKQCKISYASLNKAIKELKRVEVLLPYYYTDVETGERAIDNNRYIVNPYMYCCCSLKERGELIKKYGIVKVEEES